MADNSDNQDPDVHEFPVPERTWKEALKYKLGSFWKPAVWMWSIIGFVVAAVLTAAIRWGVFDFLNST